MSGWLALIDPVSRLLDKIIPDPEANAKAKAELLREESQRELEVLRLCLQDAQSQVEVNKIEAAHQSIFVSGWRPAVGWVCAIALAYHFVLQPFLAFAIANAGGHVELPTFDMTTLNTVLTGMLGFGGMRTYEKVKGVSR